MVLTFIFVRFPFPLYWFFSAWEQVCEFCSKSSTSLNHLGAQKAWKKIMLPGPQQKWLWILLLGYVPGVDRLNSFLHEIRQWRENCPSNRDIQKNCTDLNCWCLPSHYIPPSISSYETRELGGNIAGTLITNWLHIASISSLLTVSLGDLDTH